MLYELYIKFYFNLYHMLYELYIKFYSNLYHNLII